MCAGLLGSIPTFDRIAPIEALVSNSLPAVFASFYASTPCEGVFHYSRRTFYITVWCFQANCWAGKISNRNYRDGFFLLLTILAQLINIYLIRGSESEKKYNNDKNVFLIRKQDQAGLIPVETNVDGVVVAWSVESEGEIYMCV